MQLVAELVRLRAEQVGRAAEGPELAFQLGQLSAVAERGDRPELATVVTTGIRFSTSTRPARMTTSSGSRSPGSVKYVA